MAYHLQLMEYLLRIANPLQPSHLYLSINETDLPMRTQILFSLLIAVNSLFAQQNEWGIGVIDLQYDNVEHIYVYDSPNGKVTGTLGMEPRLNDDNLRTITWRDIEHGGPRMYIPEEALIEIGYEINGLVVREEKNGFLKIMYTKGAIISWVSKEELKEKGMLYTPWIEFMNNPNMVFFTMDYGMNLRVKPDVNSGKILLVKGDQFEIQPTGNIQGLWAEVEVKEYNSVYCESPHELVETYKGWIKILDDLGFPNIWFYTRGC